MIQQVDTIPVTHIEGTHWDFDYVWRSQGNHIVLIDLYNIGENQGITTYTFNMGTQKSIWIHLLHCNNCRCHGSCNSCWDRLLAKKI